MAAIVTLTLNPALDITTSVDVVSHTHKLRCGPASTEAGGGGVNVARVADRLGATAPAILPLGGASGTRLARRARSRGRHACRYRLRGEARELHRQRTQHGQPVPLRGARRALDADTLQRCPRRVLAACADAKCFAISGSMPGGVPDGHITELIEAVAALGVDVVVDTSGPALLGDHGAESGGKAERSELCGAVGRELFTEYEIQGGLVELMASARCGAIVVSIGAGGAMVLDQDGRFVRFGPRRSGSPVPSLPVTPWWPAWPSSWRGAVRSTTPSISASRRARQLSSPPAASCVARPTLNPFTIS
ncbi:MAG: PfkB family carbohydrate kinase [Acidimicrobiales bacterium]